MDLAPLAAMIQAIAEMVTEIVKGQTPEQKKQMWDWYIEDTKRWREFWGVK